jgi:hypothetical protein
MLVRTAVVGSILLFGLAGRAEARCSGDCNGDNEVALPELVTCVNVALATRSIAACPACSSDGAVVGVTDLIASVGNSLGDCPPTATPTATPTITPTPTVTPTGTRTCPLAAGQYTLTQTEGGHLTVDSIPGFDFPSGGRIVMDVGEASFPECRHSLTVGFPGGFEAPVFCICPLGYSVSVAQTGCGVGQLDSNGGSDYTIRELGDTSDASPVCNLPQACSSGQDNQARVDITLGDGRADECAEGTANLRVSIPVFTTTWSNFRACPDPDGTFDPGTDTFIVSFPQTLDFTSDATMTDFSDLDGDGCCLAGAGPATGTTSDCSQGGTGPVGGSGTCLDLDRGTVTTAASGPIGSKGAPLNDISFVTVLPNTFRRTGDFEGTTCADPPILPAGSSEPSLATRCVTEASPPEDSGEPRIGPTCVPPTPRPTPTTTPP